MNDKKHYQQYVNAVEYSQHLEQLLSVELKNTSALLAKLAAAERERDEYAEAERSTAVKNVTLQDEIYGLKTELARRDAAASEPAVLPELEQDVKNIIGLLQENEWAEHCTKSELGRKLEGEITRLHDLRAQQQKVVELPEPVKWPEVPYRYFSEDQVFSMLNAANVKWEVKK